MFNNLTIIFKCVHKLIQLYWQSFTIGLDDFLCWVETKHFFNFLRSRMSIVSRLSFENRRDYPSCWDQCWDQLFFSQSRFLKSRFFGQDLYSSRYLSRSPRQIKTVEIYWDFQDLLRIFEISWHYRESFSRLFRDFRLKNLNKLRNLDREMG